MKKVLSYLYWGLERDKHIRREKEREENSEVGELKRNHGNYPRGALTSDSEYHKYDLKNR